MKKIDPRIVNALVMGFLALGLNLTLGAVGLGKSVSMGALFLFMSASAIGLPGAIIAATAALTPLMFWHGEFIESLRLFSICLGVGFMAERAPKVPAYVTVAGCWAALWALVGATASPDFMTAERASAWALSTLIETVLAIAAGAFLLNDSVWATIARRPRVPSVSQLLVHVVPLIAVTTMWAGLAAMGVPLTVPTAASSIAWWGVKLLVFAIALPALIGQRLGSVLARDFQEWFRLGGSNGRGGFSGLSSEYWRRNDSDDFLPASPSQENARPASSSQAPAASPALSPDRGICSLNRDGTITFINRKFAKLCGLRSTEVIGKKIDSLGINPELSTHIYRLIEETIAKGPRVTEIRLNRLPEPLRFFEVASMPADSLEDSAMSAGPECVIVTLKDITDRRTVESHLLQAQRLGSLGDLVGGVAHAFNNALTTIVGQASFAKVSGDRAALDGALDEIMAASTRAGDLVVKLRSLSEEGPSTMRDNDVAQVLEERVTLLRSIVGENYEIGWTRPNSHVTVMCDPNLICQAATNLVLNARDSYNGKSGRIEISVATETLDADVSDLFMGARPGDFARIRIKDTGFGMSPETLARAFEPLFTTKRSKGNSGLGLSIVYSIVRAHDGFLAAESHPEKGTQITIYLPLRSGIEAAPKAPESRSLSAAPGTRLESLTGNRESILVVEDEKQVRDLVAAMLGRLGYDVVSCSNGHEAIDRCRERDFDLVLLDMIMPQMNGMDVIAHIRGTGKRVQTLLMTGYGVDVEGTDPETPILSKPFDIITLGQTVKKILSGETPAAAVG